MRVGWIADGDEVGLGRARDLARSRVLDYASLYASLECPAFRERSRLLLATCGERMVGLAAVVEGVFSYRSVSLCALLPGGVPLLLGEVDPPFVVVAPQPLWHEIGRCGGKRKLEEIQMARLHPTELPDPDPRVERIERAEEIGCLLGSDFSPVLFEAGPFLGIRDPDGALVACGGVGLVTDRVAQIASMQTRPDRRRQKLATAVLTALIRELEADERRLVLRVRPDNEAAIQLYAGFGFRGRTRVAQFDFTAPVSRPRR